MAVNDLYRTAFSVQVSGQTTVNVMYFKQLNSSLQDDAQSAANIITPILSTAYSNVLASNSTNPVSNVTCTRVSRLFADTGTAIGNVGPGIGGDVMPALVACTVKIKTGFAGKTRRGRIFVGGVPSVFVAFSTVSTTAIARYQLFMDGIRNNFMGGAPVSGFQLGVFSRTRYAILSNPFDDYFKPATQLVLNGAIASMRSRKFGVGS